VSPKLSESEGESQSAHGHVGMVKVASWKVGASVIPRDEQSLPAPECAATAKYQMDLIECVGEFPSLPPRDGDEGSRKAVEDLKARPAFLRFSASSPAMVSHSGPARTRSPYLSGSSMCRLDECHHTSTFFSDRRHRHPESLSVLAFGQVRACSVVVAALPLRPKAQAEARGSWPFRGALRMRGYAGSADRRRRRR
jgi:hypothetical protein